jgi:16S rRNA (cytidine1402-2'-O)-methyltransferase
VATLYLVSTPIGNLSDLSARAADTLGRVERIFAEDTRRTRKLLQHLGLKTPLTSLYQHNEAARAGRVVECLGAGRDAAVVSDAGTPLVSDPGARVVDAALEAGHQVVPVPGPSAVLAALVGSGLPADSFTFLGFAPRKGGKRRALLERVARSEETTVLFEAPARLGRLLADLERACGSARRVAVAREMTKLHEEFVRGTLTETRAWCEKRAPRGEVTVVVDRSPRREPGETAARELAATLLAEGVSPSAAVREVTARLGVPRNRSYRIVHSTGARVRPETE